MRGRKTENRRSIEFAVVLAGIGVGIASLALWRHHVLRAAIAAGAGFGALALALAARPVWIRFFRLWMRLAEGMGWVSTRLILSVFYVLILTPFGRVRRWMGHPTLDTAWHDGKTSYWIPKEPVEASIERYSKRY